MKKLLFILSFLFSLAVNAQQKITLTIGKAYGSSFSPIAGREGIVRSLGTNTYTAFPWVDQYNDGQLASFIKESSGHAAAGYLLFGKSDGDTTYDYSKIVVAGDTVIGANLGLYINPSTNRTIIDWQDNDLGPIKFAYSDDRGATWTLATSSFTYPAGYSSAQYGKIVKESGGRLLKFYYCIPLSPSDSSINGCLKSDDNGATWDYYSTIVKRAPRGVGESGNDAITNGHGWLSEIYVDNIGQGTSNNDTLVALIRDEEIAGGSHMHYYSTDGGATWLRKSGTASIFTSFADYATSVDRYPVTIVKFNDLFFIIAGARWSGNYRVAYVTATASQLLNNSGYSAVQVLSYNANADANAASNDFGYPIAVWRNISSINELLIQLYDSSPSSSGLPRDMMIFQIKILPL